MEEDDRLIKLLKNIHCSYLGNDYNSSKKTTGTVTADMINGLSKQSFPPCMQNLQRGLKENHHLKHVGRLQYGLFLKGIGLSLEEAMKFWKTEFLQAPGMDGEMFDKKYSYNVRYNYGKEGRKSNYTPYSCIKIITTNPPAAGQYHGCPFRHHDANILNQKFRDMSMNKERQSKIMEYIKGGHCQLACREYFKAVHKTEADFELMHPNQYYEESQRALNEVPNEKPVEQKKVTLVKVKNKDSEFDDSLTQEDIDSMEH